MAAVTDVLSCGDCGSRRLSGTPDEGFFCHDCGLHARVDFDNDEAHGNAPDHQDAIWSSYDSRFDGPEAVSGQPSAVSSGSGSGGASNSERTRSSSVPETAPSPKPGVPCAFRGERGGKPQAGEPGELPSLLSDPHSHLRCACCFELAARCRRLGARQGLRCCVGCRCGEERE